jgi:hypothetical protein
MLRFTIVKGELIELLSVDQRFERKKKKWRWGTGRPPVACTQSARIPATVCNGTKWCCHRRVRGCFSQRKFAPGNGGDTPEYFKRAEVFRYVMAARPSDIPRMTNCLFEEPSRSMMQQLCERRTLLAAHTYTITALHCASASLSWTKESGGNRSEGGAETTELQGPGAMGL